MLANVWTTFDEQPYGHQKQSDASDHGTGKCQSGCPYPDERATDFFLLGPGCHGHCYVLKKGLPLIE
jgi:hypothetical protein